LVHKYFETKGNLPLCVLVLGIVGPEEAGMLRKGRHAFRRAEFEDEIKAVERMLSSLVVVVVVVVVDNVRIELFETPLVT
jgi:hypothetical protein